MAETLDSRLPAEREADRAGVAARTDAAVKAKSKARGAGKSRTATVTVVGSAALTLSEEDGAKSVTLVPGTSPCTLNGKECELAELQAGDKVTIACDAEGKATKIEAKRPVETKA